MNEYRPNFVNLNGHSFMDMAKETIYQRIATRIANQITRGVLKPGDRLPSVRALCTSHGISMNTAKRVFLELESLSLVNSKPQSGFFVNHRRFGSLPLSAASNPLPIANDKEPEELISKVFANMGRDDLTMFSLGVPSGSLIPYTKLNKELLQASRTLNDGGAAYESLQGNLKLRRMIATRSMNWGGNLTENDLVTTSGGMNALSFCLMALGNPGDTIAVESPCFPGIFQLAISLGLKVLELPTHPIYGVEIAALAKVVSKINLCLLIPNFNTPLGSCMPDEHKREVVRLLSKHGVPLIEDDIYGDLYFGPKRPKCCKSYDDEGNVLWCSSISKTLAPGFRVGWIAPGKYKERILKLKLVHSISSATINQEVVGNFMLNGKYETHLHQIRKTLYSNYQNYLHAIAEHFPEGTKASRPQGGLALWVELNQGRDTIKLYDLTIRHHITIAPGRMFTLQNQFQNCMRICLGLPWTDELEQKLKKVGTLAKLV